MPQELLLRAHQPRGPVCNAEWWKGLISPAASAQPGGAWGRFRAGPHGGRDIEVRCPHFWLLSTGLFPRRRQLRMTMMSTEAWKSWPSK